MWQVQKGPSLIVKQFAIKFMLIYKFRDLVIINYGGENVLQV